jgi:aminoglycoside/choline kinase family phosphotransferase
METNRAHADAADGRLDALRVWLAGAIPAPITTAEPASFDASFRRYFRITLAEAIAVPDRHERVTTLIAMDAPPPQEDCRPYVAAAKLLAAAGLHAPAVLAMDFERGFLLLTDLGTRTYLDALDRTSAPALYADASAALVRWQLASRDGVLPRYDETLLRRELDLFPDWYVAKHLGATLTAAQKATLDKAFRTILDNNLAQAPVFVHRDYHSRNLMVTEPNPGVLDFQDAVYGPITYDLVSLLRDAYIEWDEERQIDWAVRYWERARGARLPVGGDFGGFWRDFEWMGVQRQLKVLGIFARLHHRDGKDGYLQEMPRVMRYLRGACARYRELGPLLRLLDELQLRQPVAGYTF